MKTYSIITGPSKFALFHTFPDKVDGHRRSVSFDIRPEGGNGTWSDIHVVINQISWEDGSGESWCFNGFVTKMGWASRRDLTGQHVNGYFRTDKRNCGYLEILEDHPALT